jgi:hypothetical protein
MNRETRGPLARRQGADAPRSPRATRQIRHLAQFRRYDRHIRYFRYNLPFLLNWFGRHIRYYRHIQCAASSLWRAAWTKKSSSRADLNHAIPPH